MNNTNDAIVIDNLHFSYGRREVLLGVDMRVPQGSIFGFLGRNGAGKTTTIKTLLGLHRAKNGHCQVNGLDPATHPLEVRASVGYMAEDQKMYGWMRVSQLIDWVRRFYPTWDTEFVDSLAKRFELDSRQKVGKLSKGQNSRLALLLALGHRPRTVILDDPTLGLDPIARKDFLRYVIDLLQNDGVTVFFSSHMLYEIDPIADHLAIIDGGRIVRTGESDAIRSSVKKYMLKDADSQAIAAIANVPGLLDVTTQGNATMLTSEKADETRAKLSGLRIPFDELGLNLDEIFEAYVIGNRGKGISNTPDHQTETKAGY